MLNHADHLADQFSQLKTQAFTALKENNWIQAKQKFLQAIDIINAQTIKTEEDERQLLICYYHLVKASLTFKQALKQTQENFQYAVSGLSAGKKITHYTDDDHRFMAALYAFAGKFYPDKHKQLSIVHTDNQPDDLKSFLLAIKEMQAIQHKQKDDDRLLRDYLYMTGDWYKRHGDIKKSLTFFNHAIQKAMQMKDVTAKDEQLLQRLYTWMAALETCPIKRAPYVAAGIKLKTKHQMLDDQDYRSLVSHYFDCATRLDEEGQSQQALIYWQQAIDEHQPIKHKEENDFRILASCYFGLGLAQDKLAQTRLAFKSFHSVFTTLAHIKTWPDDLLREKAIYYDFIGRIKMREKKYEEALTCFFPAIHIRENLLQEKEDEDFRRLSAYYARVGIMHHILKKADMVEHFISALNCWEKIQEKQTEDFLKLSDLCSSITERLPNPLELTNQLRTIIVKQEECRDNKEDSYKPAPERLVHITRLFLEAFQLAALSINISENEPHDLSTSLSPPTQLPLNGMSVFHSTQSLGDISLDLAHRLHTYKIKREN